MRFLGNGTSPVLHTQVIKEHPSLQSRAGQASLRSVLLMMHIKRHGCPEGTPAPVKYLFSSLPMAFEDIPAIVKLNG